MRSFYAVLLLPCLLFSCSRGKDAGVRSGARPSAAPQAVLQAGKYPLWFQLTDAGPVLIDSIEDACFSAAFIPWPHARHIGFILPRDSAPNGAEILMAVNRDGFMRLSKWQGDKKGKDGIGLYRFAGGEYWQLYTTGAFFLLGEERRPLALLYRDEVFVDSALIVPNTRLWTFDLQSAMPSRALPYSKALPALDAFPPEEGWNIDTFRQGASAPGASAQGAAAQDADAYWYFRAVRKTEDRPEIRMIRTKNFSTPGEQVSLGAFQNSALPEPVSAAPEALGKMLGVVFSESGVSAAAVISPEFQSACFFAADTYNSMADNSASETDTPEIDTPETSAPDTDGVPDTGTMAGFFSGAFLLAVSANGEAFYIEANKKSPSRFSLPALPEGFVYTGIAMIDGAVFASWEEQDGYSIGAAGFMLINFDSSIVR